MDEKIKKIQTINRKEGKQLSSLLKQDKINDKILDKKKKQMKGKC